MKLYDFQDRALDDTCDKARCAYYMDMGLGKTFVGAEKLASFGDRLALVVCQKSKREDWANHFAAHYHDKIVHVLRDKKTREAFFACAIPGHNVVGIINYEMLHRTPELDRLRGFTLLLDESSLIQHEQSQRSKAALRLKPDGVILLSGTPTGGKYERLWTQCRLLGWNITKRQFYRQYVVTELIHYGGAYFNSVVGYKNVEHLRAKLREYGAIFMTTKEARLTLPEVTDITIKTPRPAKYKEFIKNRVVKIGGVEIVGGNGLTLLLGCRLLCGSYNADKYNAVMDILDSTESRLVFFYNFNAELEIIRSAVEYHKRPYAVLNGENNNMSQFNNESNGVAIVQYQAGAMGHNLQAANISVYFSPPLSSELYEQSRKRTHRIGQKNTCMYYHLVADRTVEEKIYKNLAMRKDYNAALFESEVSNGE